MRAFESIYRRGASGYADMYAVDILPPTTLSSLKGSDSLGNGLPAMDLPSPFIAGSTPAVCSYIEHIASWFGFAGNGAKTVCESTRERFIKLSDRLALGKPEFYHLPPPGVG